MCLVIQVGLGRLLFSAQGFCEAGISVVASQSQLQVDFEVSRHVKSKLRQSRLQSRLESHLTIDEIGNNKSLEASRKM
jgi:hypothetical protein